MGPKKSKGKSKGSGNSAGNNGILHQRVNTKKSGLDFDYDVQLEKSESGNEEEAVDSTKIAGASSEAQDKGGNGDGYADVDVDADADGVLSYYLGLLDENTSINQVIQVFMLIFLANMEYLVYQEKNLAMDNLMNSGFIILIALLESVAVLNSRYKVYEKNRNNAVNENENENSKTVEKPQLLEFNYVFNIILPLLLVLNKDENKLVIVAAMVVQLSSMIPLLRIIISYIVLFQFNESLESSFELTVLPLVHCLITEINGRYLLDLPFKYEKDTISILITSMIYFVTDSNSNLVLVVMKYSFISLYLALILSYPLFQIFQTVKERTLKFLVLISVYVLFVVSFCIIADKLLLKRINQFPLNWLVDFIVSDAERLNIFKIWLLLTAIIIPVVFCLKIKSLSVKRKIWHVLLVLMLLPAIHDAEFVSMTLIGILGLLVVIETIRYNEIPPVGSRLKSLFKDFQDDKDNQGLVTSYIYLIAGFGMPLWLNNNDFTVQSSYIGIISIGLGDTLACLVGRRFGQSKWWGSSKSMEGSVAMFGGMMLGYALMDYVRGGDLVALNWSNRIVCSVLLAVFEGVSDLNDNLYVPLMGYVLEEVLIQFN